MQISLLQLQRLSQMEQREDKDEFGFYNSAFTIITLHQDLLHCNKLAFSEPEDEIVKLKSYQNYFDLSFQELLDLGSKNDQGKIIDDWFNSQSQYYFNHVFPKPQDGMIYVQSKNKNIPKFLQNLCTIQNNKLHEYFDDNMEHISYIKSLLLSLKQIPQNNLSRKTLEKIFFSTASKKESLIARLFLDKLLRKELRKNVLNSSKMTTKLIHLNALKVYKLRCKNNETARRFTSD